MLFNSKINIISNIYSCFNINNTFIDIYKQKNIQDTYHIDLNFKKKNYIRLQQKNLRIINNSYNITNHYKDIEDNCDWGWFVAIDEFEVHRR